MNSFTVKRIDNMLEGIYDDGELRLTVTQPATDDFLFDCACLFDTVGTKVEKIKKAQKSTTVAELFKLLNSGEALKIESAEDGTVLCENFWDECEYIGKRKIIAIRTEMRLNSNNNFAVPIMVASVR